MGGLFISFSFNGLIVISIIKEYCKLADCFTMIVLAVFVLLCLSDFCATGIS